MRKSFKNFIDEHALIQPKSKILLAVSGGVDSMVMLHLFHECGYDFAVAHCNFSLRGAESDGDELLVVDTCKRLEKKLFVKRFSTSDYASANDLSIQVAARNLRYTWFSELCKEFEYQYVAVAHNKNDVAETMLINLSRGTGLKGLTGIKPLTNGVIRPLLFASRKQLEDYAMANEIVYRNDSSNSDTKYARNRIRHNIIPEFEMVNEGVVDNLYSTSIYLSQTWQAIDHMNQSFRQECRYVTGDEIYYSIEKLLKYPFRQIFLLEELMNYGFPATMVIDIEKSLSTQPGKVFLAKDFRLIRDRQSLIITPNKSIEIADIEVHIDVNQIATPFLMQFEIIEVDSNFEVPKLASIGAFDFSKLKFPLKLRLWREGDWFVPFGMTGRKKVSDFLIDQKLPLHHKEGIYVLESNDEIIWVVGQRTDNRYRITDGCKKIFMVRLG